MNKLSFEARDGIAVLRLDNPPVNSLGLELREELVAAVERANADSAIDAMVLIGSGTGFSGGADIHEFGTPKASRPSGPARGDPRDRRQRQADHRRHRRSVHGRWSRIGHGLSLPSRRPGSTHRAAGGQARTIAGRRRHAAAAAPARGRSGAQYDRLGRDDSRRRSCATRPCSMPSATAICWRARCASRAGPPPRQRAKARTRLEAGHAERRGLLPVRAQYRQVRGRPLSRRRWPASMRSRRPSTGPSMQDSSESENYSPR